MKTTSIYSLAARLLLMALLAVFTGCASTDTSVTAPASVMEPAPQAQPAVVVQTPVPPPPPAPEPAPVPVVPQTPQQTFPQSSPLIQHAGLVALDVVAPQTIGESESFPVELRLRALTHVARVVVRTEVPENLQYVESDPAATIDGNELSWKIKSMGADETKTIGITFKALKQSNPEVCASVEALPMTCVAIAITKPAISIKKTGPETAMLNEVVTYTIVVRNDGNGTAKGVVVKDLVPEGLQHDSGQSTLTFEIGNLGAQQEKVFTVNLKAMRRGRVVNRAIVETSNAGKAEADAPTVIMLQDFAVTKVGIPEQYLNKKAKYVITVTNLGDTILQNVEVTDTAPPETSIVKAEGASVVSGNRAVWTIPQLDPGAEDSFEIVLTSQTPGTHKNTVAVTAAGMQRQAEYATLWKGYAALLIEMIDTEDPLQVDEETTYIIRVTNQGTKEDTNVNITGEFPAEITPIEISGDVPGKIDGNKVSFAPVATLPAKQSVTYNIRSKAVKIGDGRVKVYLTSDLIKTPVVEEESTHVY
jgi:uncharacterized repeat protein (TIGR01451 family)